MDINKEEIYRSDSRDVKCPAKSDENVSTDSQIKEQEVSSYNE